MGDDKLVEAVGEKASLFLKSPWAAALVGGLGIFGLLGVRGEKMSCQKKNCAGYAKDVNVLNIVSSHLCDAHRGELNREPFAREAEKQGRRYELKRDMLLAMLQNSGLSMADLEKTVETARGELEAQFKNEEALVAEFLAWLAVPVPTPPVEEPEDKTPVGEGG
jgi:hypothetical protein